MIFMDKSVEWWFVITLKQSVTIFTKGNYSMNDLPWRRWFWDEILSAVHDCCATSLQKTKLSASTGEWKNKIGLSLD